MAHNVVTAPDPVELETGLLEGCHNRASGKNRQPS
jgi:hypothetical protein